MEIRIFCCVNSFQHFPVIFHFEEEEEQYEGRGWDVAEGREEAQSEMDRGVVLSVTLMAFVRPDKCIVLLSYT